METVPFNRVTLTGNEHAYIQDAVDRMHISGNGPYTRQCQEMLEQILESHKVFLTNSGTGALEMAAILLNIQPGDEVILPTFTYVSTVNAFVLRGARPVFADILPDTLNMDPGQLEKLITPRIKCIVPVHYAGVGCEMDSIMEISSRQGLPVVEDNALGLFGEYNSRKLGSFGAMASQSFHETKNISCGEGGALVINDPSLVERAEIIWEKGTNRNQFFRGEVDEYTWVDVGSSYLPSEILAAFLFAQLEQWESIQARRKELWETYFTRLKDWASANGVGLPHVPAHCTQSYHMFYLVMPDRKDRDGLIQHLKKLGVTAVFHYLPLHLSKMGKKLGGAPGQCPVSENMSGRIVRLPFYNSIPEDFLERTIEGIMSFNPTY